MEAPHPLFPNADPMYRTVRGSLGPEVNQPAAQPYDDHWNKPPPLEAQQSPFHQEQLPQNLYMASTLLMGPSRRQLDDPGHMGPMHDDGQIDEDDTSLGGVIVSPRNADRRRQALAQCTHLILPT